VNTSDVAIAFNHPETGEPIEFTLEQSADLRATHPQLDHAARKYRAMRGPGRLITIDHSIIEEIRTSRLGWTVGTPEPPTGV